MSNRFNHAAFGVVEVIRDFGYLVRVSSKSGTQNVRRSELSPIVDEPVLLPGSLDREPDQTDDLVPPGEQVAINKVSANMLATALPHIGKARAKRIVVSRPAGGYANFADLKEVLPDLFNEDSNTDSIEWREIEPLINYET